MFYIFYRAESTHAKLKRHLGSSQGDFESSWNVINALIELQHMEIKASFEISILLLNINSIMLCLKNCGVWYIGLHSI